MTRTVHVVNTDYVFYLVLIAFYRILAGKNITIAIVGKRGNGKSSLMVRMAVHAVALRKYYEKYHTLKIDPQKLKKIDVYFEEEVMEHINWIPSKWLRSILEGPPLSVAGLDEAGNAWNNRRFNQEVNKILNETEQSSRAFNKIKVLTVPYLKQIDVGGVKQCNFYVDMFRRFQGKVYYLSVDNFTGKQYRYAIKKGRNKDYIIKTNPLNSDLYEIYKQKKMSIEVQRYLDRIRKLEELEAEATKDSAFRRAVQTALDLLATAADRILTKTGKLKASYLAAKAGVSYQIAYKVKAIYEAEGIEGLRAL